MPDQPVVSLTGFHLILADPWSKEWGQPQGIVFVVLGHPIVSVGRAV
jgi:hypothetical protein